MRKIIITVIATIFMIAPFEKVVAERIISSNNPTVNVLPGGSVKLSFGPVGPIGILAFPLIPVATFVEVPFIPPSFRRFEPFAELTSQWRLFDESITIETSVGTAEERNLSELRFILVGLLGTDFRITDKNYLRLGVGSAFRGYGGTGFLFMAGYVRKQNLSERTTVDLQALLVGGTQSRFLLHTSGYAGVMLGARLNYELFSNFRVGVQLGYTGFFSIILPHYATVSTDAITRNFIDLTVGIHYHIGRGQQQRPPRQRVAPHQRALPCPPGQMRHGRSWDRPSSVFNHPSGR